MSSYDIETTVTIDDKEVDVLVDYTVTSSGSPGCGPSLTYPGDPPEPPEFEINSITFESEGIEGKIEWEKLSQADQGRIDEAVYEAIYEHDNEPDYPEPDYD